MEGTAQQPAAPAQQTSQSVNPVNPVSNVTQPVSPQNFSTSQSEHHTGKSFVKILFLLIIIVGATAAIVFIGYRFMGVGSTTVTTTPQNANVFREPTQTPVTPTPAVYKSNPSDTSDPALDQDTQISNNSMTNLDTSLIEADQSLLDKQTNLQ